MKFQFEFESSVNDFIIQASKVKGRLYVTSEKKKGYVMFCCPLKRHKRFTYFTFRLSGVVSVSLCKCEALFIVGQSHS